MAISVKENFTTVSQRTQRDVPSGFLVSWGFSSPVCRSCREPLIPGCLQMVFLVAPGFYMKIAISGQLSAKIMAWRRQPKCRVGTAHHHWRAINPLILGRAMPALTLIPSADTWSLAASWPLAADRDFSGTSLAAPKILQKPTC